MAIGVCGSCCSVSAALSGAAAAIHTAAASANGTMARAKAARRSRRKICMASLPCNLRLFGKRMRQIHDRHQRWRVAVIFDRNAAAVRAPLGCCLQPSGLGAWGLGLGAWDLGMIRTRLIFALRAWSFWRLSHPWAAHAV